MLTDSLGESLALLNLELDDQQFLSSRLEFWIRANTIPETLKIDSALSMKRRQSERKCRTAISCIPAAGRLWPTKGTTTGKRNCFAKKEYDARFNTQLLEVSSLLDSDCQLWYVHRRFPALCLLAVYERNVVSDTASLIRLLVLSTIVVLLATTTANDTWRAELIPLSMFAMILTISFRRESALLVASAVAGCRRCQREFSTGIYYCLFSHCCLLSVNGKGAIACTTDQCGGRGGVITLANHRCDTLAGQTFGSTGLEFWDQLLNEMLPM